MLDFGWAEFIIIALIGLIVVGPKDIPRLMYQAGRLFRRLHYMKFALSQQFDDFMEKAEASAQEGADQKGETQNSSNEDNSDEDEHLELDETNPYFVKNDDEADLDGDLSSVDENVDEGKRGANKS